MRAVNHEPRFIGSWFMVPFWVLRSRYGVLGAGFSLYFPVFKRPQICCTLPALARMARSSSAGPTYPEPGTMNPAP